MAPSPPDGITAVGSEKDVLSDAKLPGDTPVEQPESLVETAYLTPEESTQYLTALEVGSTTKSTHVFSRRVLMKTANTEGELAIGQLVKPWAGTDAYNRAYKTALMAVCVLEIDGQPLAPPAISDDDLVVHYQQKFEKARKYYPVFIDAVYEAIIEMEQGLKPLLEKLYTAGKGLS